MSPLLAKLGAAALAAALEVALAGAASPTFAAFEFGDASPGSLGAASLEGPRAWLLPGTGGADGDVGTLVAFSHAALFGAPDLAADAVTLATCSGGVAGEIGVTMVGAGTGAGTIRERTLHATLRERGGRAVRLSATAERLDLEVPAPLGRESRGGWCLGFGAIGNYRRGAASFELTAGAERAVRGNALAALGVAPEFRVEGSLEAGLSRLTVADRWSADGRHLARVVAEIPIGSAASLRFGRSGSPARIGAAIGVRIGDIAVSVGRLEDPSAATVTSAEITFAKRSGSRCRADFASRAGRAPVVGQGPVCYHAYR